MPDQDKRNKDERIKIKAGRIKILNQEIIVEIINRRSLKSILRLGRDIQNIIDYEKEVNVNVSYMDFK